MKLFHADGALDHSKVGALDFRCFVTCVLTRVNPADLAFAIWRLI